MTYPHMLAFPLHMAIMTDGSFPFPAIGTVHLENSITQHRPIAPAERLQVTATGEPPPAPQGPRLRHGHRRCTSAGEPVWEGTSTYLRSGKGDKAPPHEASRSTAVAASGIEWRLPGDLGRGYAAVSGDHNPIHLYPLTAKAFGFPRQIAHGMWSKARCVAALENRLPDAVRVDVAFKKPMLPARARWPSGHVWSTTVSTSRSPGPATASARSRARTPGLNRLSAPSPLADQVATRRPRPPAGAGVRHCVSRSPRAGLQPCRIFTHKTT